MSSRVDYKASILHGVYLNGCDFCFVFPLTGLLFVDLLTVMYVDIEVRETFFLHCIIFLNATYIFLKRVNSLELSHDSF